MSRNDEKGDGVPRERKVLLSKGHNPPRFIDEEIPTYESTIYADGGPGIPPTPGAQGSNPWILGSLTIGSGNIYNITYYRFDAGSPNVFFKLRHNHSGTNAANPGGTKQTWHLPTRGFVENQAEKNTPLRSIRGPGTLFLYGFGPGSSNLAQHRGLTGGANARWAGLVRGYMT